MPVNQSEAPWPALRRASRTVVVVDVVESVRLMEQDEDDTIRRWQSFVGEVVTRLLPQHGGRLIKSLGDGLMLEFESVPPAVQCALAMQQAIQPYNLGRLSEQWMCLRVGAHVADVVVDERDIYGAGVNLAARLATLAGPGEIVVSAEARDGLIPELDASVEDLGMCYLKHIRLAVRAFRIGPVVPRVAAGSERVAAGFNDLRPTVAVVPFSTLEGATDASTVGEVLVDDLIATLSRSERWNVISRLSTTGLMRHDLTLDDLSNRLGATYVVSGRLRLAGSRVLLNIEVCDTRDSRVVWSDRQSGSVQSILTGEGDLIVEIASSIGRRVLGKEMQRSASMKLPTLESHSILLSAISWVHQASHEATARAQEALEFLSERHPRAPEPPVWMAKACVMRFAQAWSKSRRDESDLARSLLRRVLDSNPQNALGLAIEGHVIAYIDRDLDAATRHFDLALASNPNEPLAWLFKSSIHVLRGDGVGARQCVSRASILSPLDPLGYYFDGFSAWAALACGDYEGAEGLALRSMRANRNHRPTYSTLAIAQVLAGHGAEAHQTALLMRDLFPDFSVRRYSDGFPSSAGSAIAKYAQALIEAGLPA